MFFKIVHKLTKHTMVVEELSDFLFEEGWRHEADVPTSQVNIHEVDENNRLNSIRQYGF